MSLSRKLERTVLSGIIITIGLGIYLFQDHKLNKKVYDSFNKGKLEGWIEAYEYQGPITKFAPYNKVELDSLDRVFKEL